MLTGACDVLPDLHCNNASSDLIGYAIMTGPDCSSNGERQPATPGYSTFFKVLIIHHDSVAQLPFSLYTFSSQEARWSTPTKCTFDAMDEEGDCMMLHNDEAELCNGTAYWLVLYKSRDNLSYDVCVLDIDTETCRVSLTRIEIPDEYLYSRSYNVPRLKVTTGRTLSVFCLPFQGTRGVVFTQKNDNKSENEGVDKWLQTHIVELEPHMKTPVEIKGMCFDILDEKAGTLLVDAGRGNMSTADLKTGKMEKATGWSYGLPIRDKVVLLEMDWPSFFASRLRASPCVNTDSQDPQPVAQRVKRVRKASKRYPSKDWVRNLR
jgi:hypothetical protein